MRKSTKAITITIIIVLVLGLLAGGVFCLFEMKMAQALNNGNTRAIYEFYHEDKNSLDGVYLGSSAANRFWAPTRAFETQGFCIYNMGTTVQPFVATKYLVEEALKSQKNMKVIVIELRCLARRNDSAADYYMKFVSDAMPYSKNRSEMIEAYVEFSKSVGADIDTNTLDYHFPPLREKGAWLKEFDRDDLNNLFDEDTNVYKGFIPNYNTHAFDEPETIDGTKPADEEKEKVLADLFEYCRGIEPEVIFVSAPYHGLNNAEELNYIMDECRNEGFTVLDFNSEPLKSDIAMDFSSDFYNYKHTNVYGALRYSEYLADYLADNYDLPDHRGDSAYDSWQKRAEDLDSTL